SAEPTSDQTVNQGVDPFNQDTVKDRIGLVRFLNRAGKPPSTAPKRNGHTRDAPMPVWRSLSQTYGVNEFLLHHFSYPSIRGAILVRDEDWGEVPKNLFPEGVRYRMACRNLLYADTVVARLTVGPGAATVSYSHPGFEVLVVADGEADV